MNASLRSLTRLSIAAPHSSLLTFLTFLQLFHVPAGRSTSQLRPELERKYPFLQVSILPKAPS